MALIHEDGTGKADAESLCSLTFANTYHSLHGNAAWTGADPVKEAALRKGTKSFVGTYLSRLPGTKKTSTQALPLPRVDAYDAEGYPLANDEVWLPVQESTAELGLRALTEELAPDAEYGGMIQREKVGPIEIEYQGGANSATTRPWIDYLLASILTGGHALVRG